MLKKFLYIFIFLMIICNNFIAKTNAKDPFFIQEDHYENWSLTKNYTRTWLTYTGQNNDLAIKLHPYSYSLRISITLNKLRSNQPVIELDVGDFTCELKKEETGTYKTVLEPISTVQFINNLKQQKIFTLIVDEQKNYTIPLAGINKAINEMENFAKDHYIILPPPFSSKIDEFTTMDIPNIVPPDLYPLFRQQAALARKCKEEKNNRETCEKEYSTVLGLLKQNNICQKEKNQFMLSYNKSSPKSYQWISCNASQKYND